MENKQTTKMKKHTIETPGCEPYEVDKKTGIDTLRAYAFVREPMTLTDDAGRKTTIRDISCPWGVTDDQAKIATNILCHRLLPMIQKFLPNGASAEVVKWDENYLIEATDGWTIWPEINTKTKLPRSTSWNVYNPEGFEVVENVTQTQAVAEFIAMLHRWHVFNEMTKGGKP